MKKTATDQKSNFEVECRDILDRYFAAHPDGSLQKSTMKALRFLLASGDPLSGKPAGWAAGLVYLFANRNRFPVGLPGLLNSEVETYFGTSMSTIRKRAIQIEARVAV